MFWLQSTLQVFLVYITTSYVKRYIAENFSGLEKTSYILVAFCSMKTEALCYFAVYARVFVETQVQEGGTDISSTIGSFY